MKTGNSVCTAGYCTYVCECPRKPREIISEVQLIMNMFIKKNVPNRRKLIKSDALLIAAISC